MSRIKGCFERLKSEGRKALIPYITAGDPDQAVTLPMMQRLVESGADIIELGIPFSDPMADGPVIQRAAERALRRTRALFDAIVDSGMSRLRPVSMAALTTALGLIPLLLDAFFVSMAVTIIFGLMVATVLTMVVVPVLYAIFFRVPYPRV